MHLIILIFYINILRAFIEISIFTLWVWCYQNTRVYQNTKTHLNKEQFVGLIIYTLFIALCSDVSVYFSDRSQLSRTISFIEGQVLALISNNAPHSGIWCDVNAQSVFRDLKKVIDRPTLIFISLFGQTIFFFPYWYSYWKMHFGRKTGESAWKLKWKHMELYLP